MQITIRSRGFVIIESGIDSYRLAVACNEGIMHLQVIKGKTWHANMGEIYDPETGMFEESPCACEDPEELLSQLTVEDPIVQRLLEKINGKPNNAVVPLLKGTDREVPAHRESDGGSSSLQEEAQTYAEQNYSLAESY